MLKAETLAILLRTPCSQTISSGWGAVGADILSLRILPVSQALKAKARPLPPNTNRRNFGIRSGSGLALSRL